MLIETAIYKLLNNSAALQAIVGERIFAGVIPQTVDFPAIAYRPPSSGNRERFLTLDGGCSLIREFIQVFSVTQGTGEYEACALLDDAICTLLHEYSGTVTDTTASPQESLYIQQIFEVPGSAHLYGYEDESQRHHFVSKFEINYGSPPL